MRAQAELAHLFRALKAPAAARALPKLAERARAEEWSYERFAQALLETEVSARDSHGGEARIRQARFPARKTLEEFDFTFQRSVKKTVIEHLGQLDFLHAKECIVALGPPGTGKTHLAIALGMRACLAGHRVRFATATEWVARLAEAKREGRLEDELATLGRIPLLVVDLCRDRDYAERVTCRIFKGPANRLVLGARAGPDVGIVTALRGRRGGCPGACSVPA
ncbi:MAG TPA: ATP-binding protein [Gemmatimonadaceae bacterium]|nr:ATP-binding protein [Gemmatimonadaceae bacterium]